MRTTKKVMMAGMMGGNPSFNSRYTQQNVPPSFPMARPFILVSTSCPPEIEQVIPTYLTIQQTMMTRDRTGNCENIL